MTVCATSRMSVSMGLLFSSSISLLNRIISQILCTASIHYRMTNTLWQLLGTTLMISSHELLSNCFARFALACWYVARCDPVHQLLLLSAYAWHLLFSSVYQPLRLYLFQAPHHMH